MFQDLKNSLFRFWPKISPTPVAQSGKAGAWINAVCRKKSLVYLFPDQR